MEAQTEKLIREAVSDWTVGGLSSLSAMIVIHSLLYPAKPSQADLEWAAGWVKKHVKPRYPTLPKNGGPEKS